MQPTPLHTLLEERLQSAKGLGWAWQEQELVKEQAQDQALVSPPLEKGGRGDLPLLAQDANGGNPPQPPFTKGGSEVVGQGSAPAWFRVACSIGYYTLRSLGFARR